TTTASARSLTIVVSALSNSSGPRTIRMGRISNPVGPPASKTSSSMAFANIGFVEWPNTPTRRADGSISRNSSTLFPANAEAIRDTPVTLPPGQRQTGNDAGLDRVARYYDDWDLRCCLLRRQRAGHI